VDVLFFSRNGFRVIAHDRRGHGRSSDQQWKNVGGVSHNAGSGPRCGLFGDADRARGFGS